MKLRSELDTAGAPEFASAHRVSTQRSPSRADQDRETVEPISVSVVICAYTDERWTALRAAVRSVLAQTPAPREVIVVIDHNESLLARASSELSDVRVVANTGPRGLSGARNVGLTIAGSDVVAFLDDDAQARPGWLGALIAGYGDSRVTGVGGAVLPSWVAGRPRWFPAEFDWVVGCSHAGLPAGPEPVRNFVGANMSLRRRTLVELGGFSGHLGRVGADAAGCEETELCIRAGATAASALLYDPAAVVVHTVPPSRATLRYFARRCRAEGRSKAMVRHLAGARRGLASERAYLRRTLPQGLRRELLAAARGEVAALLRAAMMIVGVTLTVDGYLRARLDQRSGLAGGHR